MPDASADFEPLIDEIYEASVMADRWPPLLDRLAAVVDGEGALIFAAAPGVPRWLSSERIYSRVERWTRGPYAQRNPRGERLVPNTEARFLTDLDAFTEAELDAEPFYSELLRPNGLGWCVGTTIRSPAGDTLVISIEKAYAKGPVERATAEKLDILRPHLARAAVLSGRLGFERARIAVNTLDLIGLPAAAVTQTGRAVAANPSFLALGPAVQVGANDQVQFASSAAQIMFKEALTVPSSLIKAGRSIPVAGSEANAPFIAHVLPLRLSGLDLFAGAVSIVFLTPVTQQRSPGPELLQALFDLTPAEARIASLVIDGKSVDSISKIQRVSLNTVRTQLKSVFMKTGVDRQVDLVRLLGQRHGQPTL